MPRRLQKRPSTHRQQETLLEVLPLGVHGSSVLHLPVLEVPDGLDRGSLPRSRPRVVVHVVGPSPGIGSALPAVMCPNRGPRETAHTQRQRDYTRPISPHNFDARVTYRNGEQVAVSVRGRWRWSVSSRYVVGKWSVRSKFTCEVYLHGRFEQVNAVQCVTVLWCTLLNTVLDSGIWSCFWLFCPSWSPRFDQVSS